MKKLMMMMKLSVTMKTDDPDISSITFRTLFLGIIWAVFLSISNALFSFRNNAFIIPSSLALLLSYPMGTFLASVLPSGILNPGPFTVKEHALIVVIASAAGGLPYGVDNVVTQRWERWMGDRSITIFNSLPWVLSTQFIGYGIAGIAQRYLVKPCFGLVFFPSLVYYTLFIPKIPKMT